MKPLHHLILSVNESAAYETKSGLYKAANFGSAYDNSVQYGVVMFTPPNCPYQKGDVVYFMHFAIDKHEIDKYRPMHRNIYVDGIEHLTYVIERGSWDERVGWEYWILGYERDGKWHETRWKRCEGVQKPESRNGIALVHRDNIEPNLLKHGDTMYVIKKDTDYPLEIDGVKYVFAHDICGEWKDGVIDVYDGWTIVESLEDVKGFVEKGSISVYASRAAINATGRVLRSKEFEIGGVYKYTRTSNERIEIGGEVVGCAVKDEYFLAKLNDHKNH